MKKICTVVMVQFILMAFAYGQSSPKTKWAVGFYGGPTMLLGDFNNAGKTINGYDIGFLGQKAITHALSLRIDAGYAQYKGIEDMVRTDGKVSYINGYKSLYAGKPYVLNYKTYTYYGDILLQANLPLASMFGKEKTKLNVYGFGGLGLSFNQVRGNRTNDANGKAYDFSSLGTNGSIDVKDAKDIFDDTPADGSIVYLKYDALNGWWPTVSFVGGAGVTYNLNEKWEIFGELRGSMGYAEDSFDGVKHTSNGSSSSFPDVLAQGHLGVKYRFHKNDKNAIDWFDNSNASHYQKTLSLEEKIDGIYSDSDGDGVPDYLDKEPNTASGASVDGSGRAMDADYDGIPDYADDDLFTPKGNTTDKQGKGIDSDGDGVPDAIDLEPNTPKGNLVNFQGISIANALSIKPTIPAVYFDYNNSVIKAESVGALASVISALKDDANAKVMVIGHTDHVGTEKFNYSLGMKRAEAVKDALVKAGVAENRIITDSKGKVEPFADGKYKISTMMNRRAELKIIK